MFALQNRMFRRDRAADSAQWQRERLPITFIPALSLCWIQHAFVA
jgi:hypothetical protein